MEEVAALAAVLACEGVTKTYGGVHAVDSVTLAVPRTGLFGLCGFNGAGKSTLFNLLAGSVRADTGQVRIDGQDATVEIRGIHVGHSGKRIQHRGLSILNIQSRSGR